MPRGNGMRRLGGVWLCLLLAGCPSGCSKDQETETPDAGPVETGPEQLGEKEPNERPEQALALAKDATVSASLGADPSKPDEDWYRLAPATPPGGGRRGSRPPRRGVPLRGG